MKVSDDEIKSKRSKQSKRQKMLTMIEELIGENYTDFEIEEKLNLSAEQFCKYREVIYAKHRMTLQNLTPEKVFSDYAMKMSRVVKELDEAIESCREGNQLQAMVSAIWRKKEASDSVIKLGQELGFIPKNAKSVNVTNDISFTTMTSEELRAEIEREKQKLIEIAKRKVHIRSEVVQFMDPHTRTNLPDYMVILDGGDQKKSSIKKKAKFLRRNLQK